MERRSRGGQERGEETRNGTWRGEEKRDIFSTNDICDMPPLFHD